MGGKETSRQGSFVRFQTVNKRLGKYELVPGVETIGQTGGMRVEDRPRVCTLEVKVKVTQSCPTLCNHMDCIVHGILQARILEWVAFPFSRGSSQPRDRT